MLNRFWKRNNKDEMDFIENLSINRFQEELNKQYEAHPEVKKMLEEYRSCKMLRDLENMLDFSEYEELKNYPDTFYKYNFDYIGPSDEENDFKKDLRTVKKYLDKIEYGFIGSHFIVIVPDEFEPAGCYMDIDENRFVVRLLYNQVDIKKVIKIDNVVLRDEVTSAKIVTDMM